MSLSFCTYTWWSIPTSLFVVFGIMTTTSFFQLWHCFPEVLFLVKPSSDLTESSGSRIKFDDVIINVGGGYVANASDVNYGKFIAPIAELYKITTTFENLEATQIVGAFLVVNWDYIVRDRADVLNDHSGVITQMLRLKSGDHVWLMVRNTGNHFKAERTKFSGHLLHSEV